MSNFFIRRPIVAIVIAILTVIVGVIMTVTLPVAQFPNIAPPEIRMHGNLCRSGRESSGTGGRHANRAANQWRRQSGLHVFGKRDRQFEHDVIHRFRSQDRSQHGSDPDAVSRATGSTVSSRPR